MAATVAGILLYGTHAARPASGVPTGTIYACSDHSLIYQTTDTGATWVTWATLGSSVTFGSSGDIAASAAGNTVLAGATGKVADAGHRHAREAVGGTGDMSASAPGDTASAGATGKWIDAGHRHARTGDTFDLAFVIDGGGSAITTGIKGDIAVDFNATIQQVTLLADQSGSIVIDIWKDTYANYPPTVADTITASAKPTISSTTKAKDSTLTGWTTTITAGDTLRFNVDSITTCTRVIVILKCVRT